MIDKRQPRVSISADSIGNLICVTMAISEQVNDEKASAMQRVHTLYALMRMNGVKVDFEWADPDFCWEAKKWSPLKSVTIAGKRYEVNAFRWEEGDC